MEILIAYGLRPYKVAVVKGRNSFCLQNLDGDISEFLVNGGYLKHFIY